MAEEKPTSVCVDCGRKANAICPNVRCLAHCHDWTEQNGTNNCKRHEREWDNKTKNPRQYNARQRNQFGGLGGAGAGASSKRARTDGDGGQGTISMSAVSQTGVPDPFYLLGGAAATTRVPYNLRKCPSCEKMVPSVGTFFWLHLSQCDTATFHEYIDGVKTAPRPVYDDGYARRKDPIKKARDAALERRKTAVQLLEEVFDTKVTVEHLEQQSAELGRRRTEALTAMLPQVERLVSCLPAAEDAAAQQQRFEESLNAIERVTQQLAAAEGAAKASLSAQVTQQLAADLTSFRKPLIQPGTQHLPYTFHAPGSLFKL